MPSENRLLRFRRVRQQTANVSSLGPYEGHGSLEELVASLRRARFVLVQTFEVTGRGWVLEGEIRDGEIKEGMVILPVLEQFPTVVAPVPIRSVESVLHAGGLERVGLVIDRACIGAEAFALQLRPGCVLDVLEREPDV